MTLQTNAVLYTDEANNYIIRIKKRIIFSSSLHLYFRGAFSYVKRVTQKVDKTEYAAKFISTRAKKKTSAVREMNLLSKLDHERLLYFHDAFQKKNTVVIITELYPSSLIRLILEQGTQGTMCATCTLG